jgi:hypothetical protein
VTIIQALHDPRFFLPVFKDVRTWRSWETYFKALFGLPIEGEEELQLFKSCTNLETPPTERAREAFAICGRRSGKSFTASIIAVYLACFQNWKQILSSGSRGMIFVLSVDKYQSRIIRDYILSILHGSESFRKLIKRETEEEIELRNQVTIAVKAASFRSLRGFEILAILADEIAFWRDLETGANPAAEILRSVRPGLMNTGGLLLAISTPYSRSGSLYQSFRDHFGRPEGPLVWKAASTLMNPTLSKDKIEAEIISDPEAGKSEWLAEFRSDISSFIPFELIESCSIPGRYELPCMKDVRYFGFTDMSGGRSDSGTLAVTHKGGGGQIILDVLIEKRAPFSPEDVTEEFSDVLKSFHLSEVTGDAYAASWCSDSFRNNGIFYQPSEKSASELYLGLLPLLASGKVELLDQKRLKGQLAGLERRVRAGGRDLITHGPGMHDDLSNACAGACVLASSEIVRDDLTKFWSHAKPKPALSGVEQAKRAFKDFIGGRKPSPEELEERALEAEIEKEDRELEAELKAENPSIAVIRRGWKS